jgi:hypothetical protein
MAKKTNKCIECGTPHHNTQEDGIIGSRCFNCKLVVDMLLAFVEAQNRFVPMNGRPRKLSILGYRIEKV